MYKEIVIDSFTSGTIVDATNFSFFLNKHS